MSGKRVNGVKEDRIIFDQVLMQWRSKGLGAAISSYKCISTTPIGVPIYIWPRAAIPPALPVHS